MFFTPVLEGDFSLEIDWQKVSSSLLDSFQYSVWCKQCNDLDGLDSSINF